MKVNESQEEYNKIHAAEIEAGTLKPMNTVVHARAVDTDDPEKVAAARKEHEAVIDAWREKHGYKPHSAEYWTEYWEDKE